ncbi:hypothetical protein [Paramaledivibacter caminithermalis]|jgi:hypothetical protein|uniref:Uncharacterized protein n=1 Tax=Paramaledivibacter caminithermalis (strain DSM 15212 / CIP 107654 / DViRD3) TaxID=1121301 RepID=A0A1M6SQP4_PARC5|nr:hypothetical protein [Paramaledivibacter caminithermalis]SHK46957.1 hypothetical protein SAMN02745912_03395 [Paramaledivibacter caminithermalis DSM 15212]
MNLDVSIIFQIVMVTVLLSIFYLHYNRNRKLYFFTTVILADYDEKKLNFDYNLDIDKEDVIVYHKYDIWRFYEKRKLIFSDLNQ